jgi:hypothetical protein
MLVCSSPSGDGRAVVTIAVGSTATAGEAFLVERARHGDRDAFESLIGTFVVSEFSR